MKLLLFFVILTDITVNVCNENFLVVFMDVEIFKKIFSCAFFPIIMSVAVLKLSSVK